LGGKATRLEEGIKKILQDTGVKAIINRVGSMMTMFFTDESQVTSLEEAMKSDTAKYAKYFRLCLESGIYIAPSQFECLFVSYAQSDEDIERTIAANRKAIGELIKN